MGSLSEPPGMHASGARPRRGITLSREFRIRLSAASLGLALVGALLLPGSHRRAERRRALQTMSELRTIGTAIEAYAVDNGVFPFRPELAGQERQLSDRRPAVERRLSVFWPTRMGQRLETLGGLLSPTYIQRLPARDRWGHFYLYVTSPDRRKYTIVSTGSDGKLGAGLMGPWERSGDLVYANGAFVEWLEGT